MTALITTLNELAWGPLMLALLLGTGVFLSIGLRFMPVRRIPTGLKLLLHGRKGRGDGDISPFSALMTSLSATIGTGNIAGRRDCDCARRPRRPVLDVDNRTGRSGH